MLYLHRLLKKILHIVLLFAFINTALFVPQFSNSNTLTIDSNTVNEPDGELGSILGEILSYCFDIDVASTLNQNEEFVEKDLSVKRTITHVLNFFVNSNSLNISFESLVTAKKLNILINSVGLLFKFEGFLALLYLY